MLCPPPNSTPSPTRFPYATASNSTSQMNSRMQRVLPVAVVVRVCRLPDRKCVDHIVRCNPQALIYCQRGKQVGPRCWARGAGESWPAAESPTFSTTGAGGCRPARYLSWIPCIPWNATSNHGGASEFPLGSTYLPTYIPTHTYLLIHHLPFYQLTYLYDYLCWIP